MHADSIALIGLPGCGKSTLGSLLSSRVGLPVIDLDDQIVAMAGRTIPELFAESEDVFRTWESEALKAVAGTSAVIACGGGIVKRPENREILKENCFVVYIDRPVENIVGDIDTSGRPLLSAGRERVYQLYQEREALYRAAADAIVVNDGTTEQAVEAILTAVKDERG